MDRDEKRTAEEIKLDDKKLQAPEESAAAEPEGIESTPPADGESTSQVGDAMPDAVDESDESAAIVAGTETETGRLDDIEPAGEPLDVTSIDEPPITEEPSIEARNTVDPAESSFDLLPTTPAAEVSPDPVVRDVVALSMPNSGGPEAPWADASFDTADVPANQAKDWWPRAFSEVLVTPASDNSFPFDAAKFSPPSFGAGEGNFTHPPAAIDLPIGPSTKHGQPIEIPLARPGDHGSMERLPYIPGREPDGPKLIYLGDAPNSSSDQGTGALSAGLSPVEQASPSASDHDGSALTCPVVLVEVVDGQMRPLIEELLASAAARDAQTVGQIAKEEVEDAFWVRACHERAVYRD